MTSIGNGVALGAVTTDRSLRRLLFLYLWPFWMFKDASRGDRIARASAYRHNRGMREYLPGYLVKWLLACSVILALAGVFDDLSRHSETGVSELLTVMTAGAGILFSFGICVLFMTTYCYLYLGRNEQ